MTNDYEYHDAMPRKKALVDALGGPSMAAPPGLPAEPVIGPGGPVESGGAPAAPAGPDRSKWNTDGFATPTRVAQNFGAAPAGFDPAKWSDANHQTPKYVSTRLMTEAGDQKDGANRQKYLDAMKEAYGADNFRFNGKDKISIDGGKSFVDVWGGAGAGLYTPAWQDESSQGGPEVQAEMPGVGMGSALSPMLQGNAQSNIQAALQNIGGLQDSTRLQELIKALGGGA
jgi:hypothetical protein